MGAKSFLAISLIAVLVMGVISFDEVFADKGEKKEKQTKLQKQCSKEPKDPQKIKPECELLDLINDVDVDPRADSFFDVFFDIFVDTTEKNAVDSFFDIFVDLDGNRIDSFFDVFTEISVHEEDMAQEQAARIAADEALQSHIDTEILALQLSSSRGLTCENQEAIAAAVPGFVIDEICLASDVDGDGFRADVDCDDAEPAAFPGNTETADGIDNDCDGAIDEFVIDVDGDGFPLETDCDDADPAAFPGNTETADGIDNDCDGAIDEFVIDVDGDGFPLETDCDDADPAVNPSAIEFVGDGIDNNCDGITDNLSPIVDAGIDQIVSKGTQDRCVATFEGTATDPDGDLLNIQWSGPGLFDSPNSLTTDMTMIFLRGTSTFTLTVNDGFYEISDTLRLTCNP